MIPSRAPYLLQETASAVSLRVKQKSSIFHFPNLHREIAQLRTENQKLRKQAQRDKAAMAEALALLTLKADALWAVAEEN